MLVVPLPEIEKLWNYYLCYNKKMSYLFRGGCISFTNVLLICEYSLKVGQKTDGHEIKRSFAEIHDGWKVIHKNLVELVTRRGEP
jgi:hypothetical protein